MVPEIDDYHQSFGETYENVHNYIKPFTKPVKIYLFKKRQRLKMTIRVTDTYAMTYYWDQDAFEDMIYNWHKEWEGKARGMEVFIGPKNQKKVVRNLLDYLLLHMVVVNIDYQEKI